MATIENVTSPQILEQLTSEVLETNDLVDTPFMICDILPFSVYDALKEMSVQEILQNLYQMVYTIAAYAREGVYFRDLQPDNFRVNENRHVKLIDPSYIDASVPVESRYVLFIKQTTPEYLPNVFSIWNRQHDEENLKRYFGEFTEGVCIGMLERVLKRIFLPQYMGEKYDNLFLTRDPLRRIEMADDWKFQEDVDFFRDVVEGIPSDALFQQYQRSAALLMEREGMPSEAIPYIAELLTALRRFSYPVFTEQGCHSLLQDKLGQPVTIHTLPRHVEAILKIVPLSQHTGRMTMTARVQVAKTESSSFTLAARGITPPSEKTPPSETANTPESKEVITSPTRRREVSQIRDLMSPKATGKIKTFVPHSDHKNEPEEPQDNVSQDSPPTEVDEESVIWDDVPTPGPKDKPTTRRVSREALWRSAMDAGAKQPEVSQNPSETKEVSTQEGSKEETYKETIIELLQFIEHQLPAVKKLSEENPGLPEKLKQTLYGKLCAGATIEYLKLFLSEANNLFHKQDLEFTLLREAQASVAPHIYKDLEKYASPQDKRHFIAGPTTAQKCKKILCRYLTRIAKTRFLTVADTSQDIAKMLPSKESDILRFICEFDLKNCFTSPQECVGMIAKEIEQIKRIS
jgi:hypothetical protein